MGKLFIFIFLLLVPVTLLSTEEIKCFEEKDNQDSTLKHVTVTFKGQKYTRTIKNETKFVSCEVKVAGDNSFVFYRFEKKFTVIKKTQNAHILHVFAFDKNELKLTYEQIMKTWDEAALEPQKEEFSVILKEIDKTSVLEIENLKDPTDIIIKYFYDKQLVRFKRKSKYTGN